MASISLSRKQPPFCFSVSPGTCLLGVYPSLHGAPSRRISCNVYGDQVSGGKWGCGKELTGWLAGKELTWSHMRVSCSVYLSQEARNKGTSPCSHFTRPLSH